MLRKQQELASRTVKRDAKSHQAGFTRHILMSTATNLQGLLWPCSPVNSFTATLCMTLFYWGHEQLVQSCKCDFVLCLVRSSEMSWICLVYLLSFSLSFATFYHQKKKGSSTLEMNKIYFWSEFQVVFKDHLRSVTQGFGERVSWFGDPEIGRHGTNWWPLCFCF